MAFPIGTLVAPLRAAANLNKSYPTPGIPEFAVVITSSVAPTLMWEGGSVTGAIGQTGLDKVAYPGVFVPIGVNQVVRPSAAECADYDGITVSVYSRTTEPGVDTGQYALVELLNGLGYMEIAISDLTVLEQR